MKIRHFRKKVVVFMFSIILVLGMGACSLDANKVTNPGDAAGPMASAGSSLETVTPNPETPTGPETATPKPEMSSTSETETSQSEVGKTEAPETTAPEDIGNGYLNTEEISVGDPIIGIVEKFADNIIVIKDAGDPDLVYYFSTKNAQVVEGNSPIAAGDMVEISYRGVMGDEEHPGEAVKVVAESMMYQ